METFRLLRGYNFREELMRKLSETSRALSEHYRFGNADFLILPQQAIESIELNIQILNNNEN